MSLHTTEHPAPPTSPPPPPLEGQKCTEDVTKSPKKSLQPRQLSFHFISVSVQRGVWLLWFFCCTEKKKALIGHRLDIVRKGTNILYSYFVVLFECKL